LALVDLHIVVLLYVLIVLIQLDMMPTVVLKSSLPYLTVVVAIGIHLFPVVWLELLQLGYNFVTTLKFYH
jgi:hypothetical protein